MNKEGYPKIGQGGKKSHKLKACGVMGTITLGKEG